MGRKVKHKDGHVVEFTSVPCPEKHLLLTYAVQDALYRGEIDESWTIQQVGQMYTNGEHPRYHVYAARWVLRYLSKYGVPIPEKLKLELDRA